MKELNPPKHFEIQTLKTSEIFKKLLITGDDAYYFAELETGLIIDINENFIDLFGYERDEVIGKTSLELKLYSDPVDRARMVSELKSRGFVKNMELQARRKSGDIFTLSLSTSIVRLEIPYIVGVLRDITEKKKTEEALLKSEEKFKKAFYSSPQLLSITTLENNRLIEVNETFLKTLGYSRKETIGHTTLELGAWVNQKDRKRLINILKKEGSVNNEELQFRTKKGDILTLLFSAELINISGQACMLSTAYDITNQKKAEYNLRESEEKYRILVESANDGVAVILDGIIKFCNSSLASLLGYDINEIEGSKIDRFILPENFHLEQKRYHSRMVDKNYKKTYETETTNKSGDKIFIEISSTLIQYEAKPAVMVIIRDITEKKKTEIELHKNAEQLARILEATSDGVCDWNIQTGAAYFSSGYARILGYHQEEFANNYNEWGLVVHPDDIERVKQEHYDHFNNNKDFSIEFRMKEKLGKWHWIYSRGLLVERDSKGNPLRMFITHSDIQERKNAEESLYESEMKFRSIFEQAAVGIALVGLDGSFMQVNQKLCSILGYTNKELIRRTFQDITYPDDLEADLKFFRKMLDEKLKTYKVEKRYICKDGSVVWAKLTVSIVLKPSGEPYYFISVIEDISKRKKSEYSLFERIKELRAYQSYINIIQKKNITLEQIYNELVDILPYSFQYPDIACIRITVDGKDFCSKNYAESAWNLASQIKVGRSVVGDISIYYLAQMPNEDEGQFLKEERILVNNFANLLGEIISRKKSEQILQESEKRFRTLTENSLAGIYILQNGKLIYVNSALEKIFGYKPGELNGTSPLIVIHPDDQTLVSENMRKRLAGEVKEMRYEFKGRCKNGETKYIEVLGSRIDLDRKPTIIGTIIDITEQKLAAQELEKYQLHLEDLVEQRTKEIELLSQLTFVSLEAASVGAWWIDFKEDDTYHALDTTAKIIGLPISKLPDKAYRISEWVNLLLKTRDMAPEHAEQIELAFEQFNGTISGKYEKYRVVYPLIMPDQTIKWIDARADVASRDKNGGALVMTGTLIDVTKMVLVEKNLEQLVSQRTNELAQRNRDLQILSERLTLATRTANIGIWDWDISRDVLTWDDEMYRLYSINRDDFGEAYSAWFQAVHLDDKTKADRAIKDALDGKHEYGLEFRIVWPDGSIHYIQANAQTFRNPDGKPTRMIGVNWDITKSKHQEESLKQSEDKYKTLTEKAVVGIYIIQDAKMVYVNPSCASTFGYLPEEIINKLSPKDLIHQDDIQAVMNRLKERLDSKIEKNIISYKAIKKDGSLINIEVYGMSIVYEGRPAVMGTLNDVTDRKKAEEDLKASYIKTEKVLEETIKTLATIVEIRDPYTAGHQQKVAQIAISIAKEMGLEEDIVNAINTAAIIHDIGKISIANSILSKPGKISNLEYEMIKTHSENGYEMLKNIDFSWPIANIVLQHHERINGSGYPNGLKGDDILLEAKIIAVADTIEAIASHRPYRPSLGVDQALKEIEKNKGILYDSGIVDACIKIFKQDKFEL
jgi:PAS domain S-box-containing protein/putative nucleotidyltransferase with HDIG domain